MKRIERESVEQAADVLRTLLEQVQAGQVDAPAGVVKRLEGALLGLDTATGQDGAW